MTNVAIVGTQWGDEGKGKVVDLLTEGAHLVVRFQGGNNAGHTLVVNNQTYALHLVPSGILHEGKLGVVASGTVVDPGMLLEEIDSLVKRGLDIGPHNLKISEKAHIIMPYHKALDAAREEPLVERTPSGEESFGAIHIGTTGRGIGPAYEDKASRRGFRLGDLRDMGNFLKRLKVVLKEKNVLLGTLYDKPTFQAEDLSRHMEKLALRLIPYLADTAAIVREAIKEGRNVLFEGAQGVQLDIDHGTYPFVTSSNPVAGAVSLGVGLPPSEVGRVVGLVKAYSTRVGEGPFPTELKDKSGLQIREVGREYGTTTGRPRRCGWLDSAVVRAARDLCGLDSIAVTKLDVLRGLPELKISEYYLLDGQRIEGLPADARDLARCQPVYRTLPGFSQDISQARSLDDLPLGARNYLEELTNLCGVPLGMVSVGPDREQTIVIRRYF
jgi:adenylosuccinate synthase